MPISWLLGRAEGKGIPVSLPQLFEEDAAKRQESVKIGDIPMENRFEFQKDRPKRLSVRLQTDPVRLLC
jgi:hypothetical protein